MGKKCCKQHEHGHSHGSHDDRKERSDIWTRLGVGSDIIGVVSNWYWLASMIQLISDEDTVAEWCPLGLYGIIAGAVLAILMSASEAYCHYHLNTNNQHAHDEDVNSAISSEADEDDALIARIQQDPVLKEKVERAIANGSNANGAVAQYASPQTERTLLLGHDPSHALVRLPRSTRAPLTLFQLIVLGLDGLGHVGDVSSPMVFVVDLFTKSSLSRFDRSMVSATAFIIGVLVSVSDVRTCANNLPRQSPRIEDLSSASPRLMSVQAHDPDRTDDHNHDHHNCCGHH